MQADYPVVLDACVLVNQSVTDLLLRLALHPRLFTPKWSNTILEEVERTLSSWDHWKHSPLIGSFLNVLHMQFPEALIVNHEALIPIMENDPKDRHVLATAVKGKVELILTFNTKDFPKEVCDKWSVEVKHPQDYLLTLFQLSPNRVFQSLDDIAKRKKEDREDTLLRLGKHVPKFSQYLLGN